MGVFSRSSERGSDGFQKKQAVSRVPLEIVQPFLRKRHYGTPPCRSQLMETVQRLHHQKRICPRDTRPSTARMRSPLGPAPGTESKAISISRPWLCI
ncbi:hypothetical protein TREES_T100017949 [Tupaia chinensis]|uniref:Uncharacterized protein n=1 Tax=Tupaia chinensis TaxID=246437 RepID=L9JUA0_TUPCH|nr:hypothetical protein TREES_T100017949 [Tupaia chinensis]